MSSWFKFKIFDFLWISWSLIKVNRLQQPLFICSHFLKQVVSCFFWKRTPSSNVNFLIVLTLLIVKYGDLLKQRKLLVWFKYHNLLYPKITITVLFQNPTMITTGIIGTANKESDIIYMLSSQNQVSLCQAT